MYEALQLTCSRIVGLAAASLLALAACSSDDEPSAQERCQTLFAVYCDKVAACSVPSDRGRAEADCRFSVQVNGSCDEVVGVTPKYTGCVAAVQDIACANVDPAKGVVFPSACAGALVTQ